MDYQTALGILDLSPDSTIDDVKRVHRKFVADWHPDRHTYNSIKMAVATGITKDLNCARDFLLEYLSQPANQKQDLPAKEQNGQTMDHLHDFMAEVCSFEPSGSTVSDDLYFIYEKWCFDKNLEPLSYLQVLDSLELLGFVPIRNWKKPFLQSVALNGFKINSEWEEILTQIKDSLGFIFESEEPKKRPQVFSEMDDDDDLSEVVF
jgi:hypothetical protein